MNITDSTCDFGLAQLNGQCSLSFSSLDEDGYLRSQIIYLSVGLVSVIVACFLYYRAVTLDSDKLQRDSLLLSAYASLTFIFRSADPNSFKHVIPHPIVVYFSDSCTAALYTVFILSLSYWASVIQRGAAHIQRALDLTVFVWVAAIMLWAFYLAIDMCLFMTKGFYKSVMTYLQLLVSAGILAIIGIAFFVYGIRVRSRLRHFERQRMLYELRNNTYQQMDSSRSDIEGSDVEAGYTKQSRAGTEGTSTGHANRILKIVSVVSVFVVVVVAAQIYNSVARSNGVSRELNCANGLGCDDIKSSISMLHWLQLVAIWVVLWVNHKIERKPEQEDSDSD